MNRNYPLIHLGIYQVVTNPPASEPIRIHMFFYFDRTEPEKLVSALGACLWMMNKEILQHTQTTGDRLITEQLKQMQKCAHSIAGYLADDIPPEYAYDLIPNENVLGIFGDRQSGLVKEAWIKFCDLLANLVGKEPIYGRNDPIDTKSDVNYPATSFHSDHWASKV